MEIEIGKITHFYNRIGVAVLSLSGKLQVGDIIHVLGHTTDFVQRVESMEIEHNKVTSASAGMDVAIKLEREARKGDTLFKVLED